MTPGMQHMQDIPHMNLAMVGEFEDIVRHLPEIAKAVAVTLAAGAGIACSFGRWMTQMSEDFASASLGIFSALLLASFVELFTSLRKGAEDKAQIEELHHADIARSIATPAADRTTDSDETSGIQDYADRVDFLESRHRRHVVWWVVLSVMLAASIGLLLHWLSLDPEDQRSVFWNRTFPCITKAVYVLSIVYFVAAVLMRVSLDKHISRWKRRRALAELFGVPDTDEVFDLEKRWEERVRRQPNGEESPAENPSRAAPAQPPNLTTAPPRSRASTRVTPPPED